MKSAVIKNIGTLFTGDIHNPILHGPLSILVEDGKIKAIAKDGKGSGERVINAQGMTVCRASSIPIPIRSSAILPRARTSSVLSKAASTAGSLR